MKYEIIVFSCPNCAGMVKFNSEKCEYCGCPFYWLEDGMDKATMVRKAEEAWSPKIMEPGLGKYIPQKVAASQWSKKLYIVVSHVNTHTNEVITMVVDEVRANIHDHKTEGDIRVDLRNERSCLFFDWLRMNDEYFQVQVCEEGEPLEMIIDLCKVTAMEPVYGFQTGYKIVQFESPRESRAMA